jgi:hypothetical protein
MHPHVPVFLSILAVSALALTVSAGIAEAVGVTNGCTATINGQDPAQLDSDHPLVVRKGELVHVAGTVPSSVASAPSAELISTTHVDVDIVSGLFGVSSSDHPGRGPAWDSSVNVDKYLKYGVGLYHVTGKAVGGPGDWSCNGDGYVELKDGNPLSKPVGGAAAGIAAVGLLGAAVATRAPKPAPEAAANAVKARRDDVVASLGGLLLISVAIGCAFFGKDVGAAAVGATGLGGEPRKRLWSHGHPILGFVSGLLLGLGGTVLLQQFSVWPLTVVTVIVMPLVVAIICALRAWLGKPYRLGPEM